MIRALFAAGIWLLALLLCGFGLGAGWLAAELSKPPQFGAAKAEFKVPKGKSMQAVAQSLHEQGFLKSPWAFKLLYRLSLNKSGIQAGLFEISASQNAFELFDVLRFGTEILRAYTIPEGLVMAEIAQILETASKGAIQKQEALALMKDETFARSLGIPQPHLEGYLFPETYLFPDDTSARQIITTLVESHFKALPSDYQSKEAALGLTHHQLVTMASLVEAESTLDEERSLVSGVFHERKRLGMKMQCDPTTVYGIEGFVPPITKKDLERNHPYNTYIIPGLPPGPINNPGKASLVAALNPSLEGHLYFVAKADGTRAHQFSKTLEEHNRAVQIYRQRIKAQRASPP